jgi:hypothetical protein
MADLFKTGKTVPSQLINIETLAASVQSSLNSLRIGVYGSTKYGRCIYGVKYGHYGADKYGDATYR